MYEKVYSVTLHPLLMLPMRSKSRIAIIKEANDKADLTSRSNWMLNWTKPGPLVLTGVVGLRVPIITRGVLPKEKNCPISTVTCFLFVSV